jgi:hypothetical protein
MADEAGIRRLAAHGELEEGPVYRGFVEGRLEEPGGLREDARGIVAEFPVASIRVAIFKGNFEKGKEAVFLLMPRSADKMDKFRDFIANR